MNRPQIQDRARLARALEPMELVPLDQTGCIRVTTARGSYVVDARKKTCACGDFRNRVVKRRGQGDADANCKHLLRVLYGTRLIESALVVGTRKRTEWKEAV